MKTDDYGKKVDTEEQGSGPAPLCGYLSHSRLGSKRCTYLLTHTGPHSWAALDPAEFQDRVDPGGIERNPTVDPYVPEIPLRLDPPMTSRSFGRRPLPLPSVTVPPEIAAFQQARTEVEAEMGGIYPHFHAERHTTDSPTIIHEPPTRNPPYSPGRPTRFGRGGIEQLGDNGWEPISGPIHFPIPPPGHTGIWNHELGKWEFIPSEVLGKPSEAQAAGRPLDPVHPPHYKQHPSGVEAITIIEHFSFNIGTAMKYLWRFEHKGGSTDLEKAIWYITREIERRGTPHGTRR